MLFLKILFVISIGARGVSAVNAAERVERYRKMSAKESRAAVLSEIEKEYSLGPSQVDTINDFKQGQREVGEAFFSERAQHLYEAGLSLTIKGDSAAVRSLVGALEVEPDNLKILVCLARNYLGQENCDQAAEAIDKIGKNYFLLEERYILYGQLLVCQKKFDDLAVHVVPPEKIILPFRASAMILSLRAAEAMKDVVLNKTLALELVKIEPKFPEALYWLWKFESKKSLRKEYADRYLALCQNLSGKEKRRFFLEPNLCSSIEEVRTSSEGV